MSVHTEGGRPLLADTAGNLRQSLDVAEDSIAGAMR